MNYCKSLKTSSLETYATSAGSPAIKKLENKVAVLTASTQGIGFCIAQNLAENGAKVVVSSRKAEHVKSAVDKLRQLGHTAEGVVCHVANAEHRAKLFQTAVDKFGGIDILVSNAAVNPVVGGLFDCDEKLWEKLFEVNVKSSFLLAKEVTPYLKSRGGGSIVFVSTFGAYWALSLKPGLKFVGAYAVSKTAMLGLTKGAAAELARFNIRVNALAPGGIDTKFGEILKTPEASECLLPQIPMGRYGQPHEMGGIVTFLCSEDASYITGETIVAAGGAPSRL